MKPDGWDSWSWSKKHDYAVELMKSPRGALLLFAALVYVEQASRDSGKDSDADDLAIFREVLFKRTES